MKIIINPGHMPGTDSGAVNNNYGVTEADIVAEIGDLVRLYLENVGIETEVEQSDNLCGEDGQDYYESVCYKASGCDMMISIHANAFNTLANGTEVYFNEGESEGLAICIQDQLVMTLQTRDRGTKENPGYMVLNNTPDGCLGVLVEIAFIDNDDDCSLLINQKDEIARAIARGVTDYLCEE